MQKLKMLEEFFDLIRKGRKKVTIRTGVRMVAEGEMLLEATNNGEAPIVVRVTKIRTRPLNGMDIDDFIGMGMDPVYAERHGTETAAADTAALLRSMGRRHNIEKYTKVNEDDLFTSIHFTYLREATAEDIAAAGS